MSGDVLLVVDFNVICRFCLQSKGALTDIFDDTEDTPLSFLIDSISNLKIVPDDCLPNKICHRCRYKIEMFYEFREMITQSQKALANDVMEEDIFFIKNNLNIPNVDESSDAVQTYSKHFENSDEGSKDTEMSPQMLSENEIMYESFLVNQDPDEELSVVVFKKENDNNTQQDDDGHILEFSEYDLIKDIESNIMKEVQSSGDETGIVRLQKRIRRKKGKHSISKIKMENDSALKSNDYPTMLEASKKHQCLLCLKKCNNKETLVKHVDEHVADTDLEPYYMFGERDITCQACEKHFGYRYSFLIHQREHLNLKPFICHFNGCDAAFFSNAALRQHFPVHSDRVFICSVCAVGFKRKSDLKGHEIIHKDAGLLYNCQVCGLMCKNRLTLAAHIKKHKVEPRFKCESCPKEYFSQSELTRHSHIHSPEKRFRCSHSQCPCAYFSRSALARHERTHSTLSKHSLPRRCPLCRPSITLDSWNDYTQHMRTHLSHEFPFRCQQCDKGYFAKKSLAKHEATCQTTLIEIPIGESKDTEIHSSAVIQLVETDDCQPMDLQTVIAVTEESQHLLIVDMISDQIEQ